MSDFRGRASARPGWVGLADAQDAVGIRLVVVVGVAVVQVHDPRVRRVVRLRRRRSDSPLHWTKGRSQHSQVRQGPTKDPRDEQRKGERRSQRTRTHHP